MNEIKKIIKRILKMNVVVKRSDYNENNFSIALKELVSNNPHLLDSRMGVGKRNDGKEFYRDIAKIEKGFEFLNVELDSYGRKEVKNIFEYDGFNSGTPMKTKPFPMCINNIRRMLWFDRTLYWYPSSSGSLVSKQKFLDYLIKEGFLDNKCSNYDGIGVDNIVFTCSTTHAYSMILRAIARDEDVVLMTGPNYGLFALEPERINARVCILDLEEEDDWYVNPNKLSKKIDEINEKLKTQFKGKLPYIPKVVAFLNMNPHNPLGKVMNNKNIDILKSIGDVCLEKGVFVIDDLIYRDLTFDQNDLAVPLATFPKYFNNTISLFGISKAYGLASFRAGAIVAPIPICRAITAQIWQYMDSIPTPQIQAVIGAFNGSEKRYKMARKYFKPIISEYKYRFMLLKALIEGIDSISDIKLKNKIIRDIYKYEKDKESRKYLLKGVPGVFIKKGTTPMSGFFAVIDFTRLKGKRYEDIVINDDFDLLKFLYIEGKIKCIMGKNMSWPIEDEIVARVNFGLEKHALVNNVSIINKAVRKLK